MAENVVSLVLGKVFQLIEEERNLQRDVPIYFSDIKDELESIQGFLKDADRRADTNEVTRVWVKQVREASFRIEDVIDEYLWQRYEVKHLRRGIPRVTKTWTNRQIASELQAIKTSLQKIKERSTRNQFTDSQAPGPSSIINNTGETENMRWRDPRLAFLSTEETEIVGLEGPREQLTSWLLGGASERTCIAVVGMGGLGKTTLAKLVFDSQKVTTQFDCRAYVIVSQSCTMRGLLINMMEEFCGETENPLMQMLHRMNDRSLVKEVRKYLQDKRYLIFFDDVWQKDFSDQVELALPNNNKGGRIIITTRMMQVADFFKKSFLVHVHNLQLLSPKKARELFCKKAFRFEPDGHCPPELISISKEIVRKCKQLPLAIVTIGGLFSTKPKTRDVWKEESKSMNLKLGRDAHYLSDLNNILSLSYDDLPYYLKPCILYFSIYPEDYCINHKRLIQQWIAEGFVISDGRRTLEQVAEEYLSELIHRSLVLVSKVGFERKVKICRVHDLLRELIIGKVEVLNFCHFVGEVYNSPLDGISRRLSISISSNNLLNDTNISHFRAIHGFGNGGPVGTFIDKLCSNSRILKVLDMQGTSLNYIPNNLGNLFHLRYLNLRGTKVQTLPKSVGELHNLETLDLRETLVQEIPIEIKKLTKLRNLLAYRCNYEEMYSLLKFTTGVQIKKGIKKLTALENLCYVEMNHEGVDLIQEIKMLTKIKKLGLTHVRREHGHALSAAIVEMRHLENLNITTKAEDEIIDLNFTSSPPQLQRLHLKARLQKLPSWIPELESLVKVRLGFSMLKDDPLLSLKFLPNMLNLCLWDNCYDGETLHFQNGGFQKLRTLNLSRLNRVNSVVIDDETLLDVEHLTLEKIPQLKEVPSGVKPMHNLKDIYITDMPAEFVESIDPDEGRDYSIIKHVPLVYIRHWKGPHLYDYGIRTINASSEDTLQMENALVSSNFQNIKKFRFFVIWLKKSVEHFRVTVFFFFLFLSLVVFYNWLWNF